MTRARSVEFALLSAVLVAQAILLTRLLHSAVNYDEAVYLAAVDALRHGQTLGSQVFAAQFPGFYDLLRGISFVTGETVAGLRSGMVAVTLLGTVGGWLVGRRFGGPVGGLLVATFLTIAPPLDLFGSQVIADTPTLALMTLSLGLGTLGGAPAALAAGALFGGALSVKLTALTVAPAVIWLLRERITVAAAGFALAVAVLLAAHAAALGDLWSSGVTYHDRARSTPEVIPHPVRQIVDQIPARAPFFWFALAAALIGLAFLLRRRPLHVWPLWTWVALSVVFLLLHAPLHYNHLIVFPWTLALAAGATIGAASTRLPHRTQALIGAAVALAIGAGYLQQWHRVGEAMTSEPATTVAAARALARLTSPNALVVDDRPIISFLAHRRVVGPLVDLALLRFETGSLTDTDVIRELPQAQAVVVSRTLRDRPRVIATVTRSFRLRYDKGGVRIYVRGAAT